jgi:hypothetical protein
MLSWYKVLTNASLSKSSVWITSTGLAARGWCVRTEEESRVLCATCDSFGQVGVSSTRAMDTVGVVSTLVAATDSVSPCLVPVLSIHRLLGPLTGEKNQCQDLPKWSGMLINIIVAQDYESSKS